MKLLGALLGALVGGAIGAAIWAGIAYGAGVEIGWIAWGVGILAGLGAAVGARGHADMITGVMAALVAAGSVVAGKYAAIELHASGPSAMVETIAIDDDAAKVFMAHQLVDEYTAQNKPLKWPVGYSKDSAGKAAHFPKALWKDCTARWTAMTPDQQTALKESIRANAVAAFEGAIDDLKGESFTESFSLFDILFFFLAVASAFKLGSGGGDDD